MQYRRLRRAADVPSLQILQARTDTLQANVDLLVLAVVVVFRMNVVVLTPVLVLVRVQLIILRARQAAQPIELLLSSDFIILQIGHKLVNDVSHGAVERNVLQRVRLVYNDFARWASVVLLEVLH